MRERLTEGRGGVALTSSLETPLVWSPYCTLIPAEKVRVKVKVKVKVRSHFVLWSIELSLHQPV